MKPITIVAICVICAATLMSGCLETAPEEKQDEPYVSVAQTPTIPAATPTPEIKYVYVSPTPNPTAIKTSTKMVDIDEYADGFRVTGTCVYDGDELVSGNGNVDGYTQGLQVTGAWSMDSSGGMSMYCNVDGYVEGCHVTGTMSRIGDGGWCYDWYTKVDRYCAQGYHNTGYKTLKGCGDDVEWYSVLTATKDGYKTQYLNGYADAEWRT